MERVTFDKCGYDCIKAGNDLEEEVLRRAILTDGFDETPGLLRELEAVQRRLLGTGGRLVIDDGWRKDVAVHYELRERIAEGWYALRVSFWDRQTAADVGSFTLRAALWTFPPLVQALWLGHRRPFHCHPIWGLPPQGNMQVSGNVVLAPELPPPDAAHLLAVSAVKRYEAFEWSRVVPHLRLTDAPRPENEQVSVRLEYDPWRGGFCISFGLFNRDRAHALVAGLMQAYLSEDLRIMAVESFDGRLRLAGIGPNPPYVEGTFALAPDGGQAGPVCVRQSKQQIELWFGSSPLTQPPTHHDPHAAIAVWLQGQDVAGVRLSFGLLEVRHPINSIRISPADFK